MTSLGSKKVYKTKKGYVEKQISGDLSYAYGIYKYNKKHKRYLYQGSNTTISRAKKSLARVTRGKKKLKYKSAGYLKGKEARRWAKHPRAYGSYVKKIRRKR